MIIPHNLGFPRIGPKRELKFALEAYWHGDLDQYFRVRSNAGLPEVADLSSISVIHV